MPNYVFDACALIALADDEDGASVLESYLAGEDNVCFVHSLNFCEVYYNAHRNSSEDEAKELVKEFIGLGVILRDDMDIAFWQEVGNLKSIHRRVSLADCCAIALANRLNAGLVTSDHHEFDILDEKGVCNFIFFR